MKKLIALLTILILTPLVLSFDLIPLDTSTGDMTPVISKLKNPWIDRLFDTNGNAHIGDPDYLEGTNPIDVLTLSSHYSPSLVFKQGDNPSSSTRFWVTDDGEELHLLVSAGYWEHPFIFDEHGAFVSDTVTARTTSQARNFYAKQDGTANTPAYGKYWGNSGMFFDDDDVLFSVDRNERFRIGVDENELQGNLNLQGNLYVENVACVDGVCLTADDIEWIHEQRGK